MTYASDLTNTADLKGDQYSLVKILTIWALAAVPMPILAFVVAPAVAPEGAVGFMMTTWVLLIGGMIWQFVLSVIILRREGALVSWAAFRDRVWLNAPRDPKTGQKKLKLFWWLIPAFAFYVAIELTPLVDIIGRLILIPLPMLAKLPDLDLGAALSEPDLVGAWWLMAVAVVSCLFNYLLGEELLFRGVLLPKMRGVFGRWDWVANSALFAVYHLHRPVQMLGFIFGGLAWTLPSRYFRSNWFAVILHGIEGIPLLIGVFLVVSGLAFE